MCCMGNFQIKYLYGEKKIKNVYTYVNLWDYLIN